MTADRDAQAATPGGAPEPDPAAFPDAYRDSLAAALAPSYVLGRELLGGGMSRVFLAEEPALGRTVVVKVLPPDWAAGMNRDRFLREIQLAARLQHPHIVPLLAAGEAAGSIYYTMPYIEGESLRAELARGRRFSVREAVRVLHDVVEALAHAHARGVIHRDVKPGNVLMLGNHALVTDFGVAKALSAAQQSSGGWAGPGTTSTGLAIGTPAYMAPEQLAADPAADHRVDLYAAGLLAYELLVGHSPFTADSPQATLAAQLTRMPTPLHQLRPDVPPALSALIERCLAKEPAGRPESADALLVELEPVAYAITPGGAAAEVAHAGAEPPTAPLPAPAGAAAAETVAMRAPAVAPAKTRRPTAVLGGALLGMGIVLLGGWALVRGIGDRAPATPAADTVQAPAVATAPPPPAPTVAAAPRLTREDSLAIAAAVERRLVAEERARRQTTAAPLAAPSADSIRAQAWVMYADSVRQAVEQLTRGLGAAGRGSGRRPPLEVFSGVPDSATIVALAKASAAQAAKQFGVEATFGPPDAPRTEVRVRGHPEGRVGAVAPVPPAPGTARVHDIRTQVAIARLGERLPPPKAGVRRVLVLDINDGTGRADLRAASKAVTDALRHSIATREGYEVVDMTVLRDVARLRYPEIALAAATNSGAVITGTVYAQRDSTVGAIAIIHDVQRGYPLNVRTPRFAASDVPHALVESLGASLFKALDRVRWEPAERPKTPSSPPPAPPGP